MTSAWLAVVLVGAATAVIKASGPVLLGGRELPGPVRDVLVLLAPALLSALVATLAFASGQSLVVDLRLAGLAAAAAAIALRAPVLVVVFLAAAATAIGRFFAG